MSEWRTVTFCPVPGCLEGFRIVGPDKAEKVERLTDIVRGHVARDHVAVWRGMRPTPLEIDIRHEKVGG